MRQDWAVTAEPNVAGPSRTLRRAIVLSTTEQLCTVVAAGELCDVPYANVFPTPRVDRVAPGHLVALATAGGSEVVIWRWFDAVVQDVADTAITLWEPAHGSVLAATRNPQHPYQLGGRAYLSAGLPGADWWVAGPAVNCAEDADVELDEVERFFTDLGLWNGLT